MQRRYQLVLGKFRVKHTAPRSISVELPGLGLLICTIPPNADVREGDLLTLYTEILSGNPNPTNVQ